MSETFNHPQTCSDAFSVHHTFFDLPSAAKTFKISNLIHCTLHSTWKLRIHDKFAFARAFKSCSCNSLSQSILGFASVLSRVFRIDRRNLKNNKSKITESTNPWTSLEGLAIPRPEIIWEREKKIMLDVTHLLIIR